MRGIYIPYGRSLDLNWNTATIAAGRDAGINLAVIDVHPCGYHNPRMSDEVLALYRAAGYRIAARVVCFPDGLTRLPVSAEYMQKLYAAIEYAAARNIDEVQLDYIRFHDGNSPYGLQVKYDFY
jgi:hypothetical protein